MSLTKEDLRAIKQNNIEVTGAVMITAINDLSLKMCAGFNEMSSRLDRVEAALKVDVAILKTDVSKLKSDVRGAKFKSDDESVGRSELKCMRYLEEQIERIRLANARYDESPRTNAR